MNTILKSTLMMAALLAAGTTTLDASASYTIGAFSGKANPSSDTSCFSENYDGVVNTCSVQKRWDMPLSAFTGGVGIPVTVSAFGATSSNNVGCQSVGVSWDHGSVWYSGMQYLPSFGSAAQIELPAVYVPTGIFFAYCLVNPGGQVLSISPIY